MARFDTTAGPGSDLVWVDFYQAYDLKSVRVTYQPNNPGSIGGHALGDTFTETHHRNQTVSTFTGLVLDGDGMATAGTLTGLFGLHNGVFVGGVTGLTALATDVFVAASTISSADDQILWIAQLSGHDTFRLSAFNDSANGFGGDDMLAGNGGDDQLAGGDGDDRLFGGDGDDRLFGENGNDSLHGGAGDDTLYGGVHSNLGDSMFGGAGSDQFVFGIGAASGYIHNFQHGQDKIVIEGQQTLSFEDLDILGSSADTLIFAGSTMIRLHLFNADHLDASDFVFH